MAVNYYDQFQPLTYNPMTLQEMLIGPQMMQQRHDQYQALLDQEGLFDVPALDVDKPGVQQWMDKYKGEINDLSDQLLRSGYNKDLSRRARQILQEKQQATSSRGYLGKANAAYQQYLSNVESEKKRLEKGEINRDQFERGISLALQRYNEAGGVGKDASYSPWYSTKAVDLQDLVSKYGKEITPQTIANDLGYKYDPSTGIITDSSNKTVTISPERIKNIIISRIMSNPEAMAYLKERQQLGLTNDVMEDLNRLGNEGALTFYRNDVENKSSYDFGLFKKYQEGAIETEKIAANARLVADNQKVKFLDLNKEAKKTGEERASMVTQYDIQLPDGRMIPSELDMPLVMHTEYSLIGGRGILNTTYYRNKYGKDIKFIKRPKDEIERDRDYVRNNNAAEDLLKNGYEQLPQNIKDVLSYDKYKEGFSKLSKQESASVYRVQLDGSVENAFPQDKTALEMMQIPGTLDNIKINGETILDEDEAKKAIFGKDPEKITVSQDASSIGLDGTQRYIVTTSNKNGGDKKSSTVDVGITENRATLKALKQMWQNFCDNNILGEIEISIEGQPFKVNRNVIDGQIMMSVQEGRLVGTQSGRAVIEYSQPIDYKEWAIQKIRKDGIRGNFRLKKTNTPNLIE